MLGGGFFKAVCDGHYFGVKTSYTVKIHKDIDFLLKVLQSYPSCQFAPKTPNFELNNVPKFRELSQAHLSNPYFHELIIINGSFLESDHVGWRIFESFL
jgi:hypothetical protein